MEPDFQKDTNAASRGQEANNSYELAPESGTLLGLNRWQQKKALNDN